MASRTSMTPSSPIRLGKMFVGPTFDYLLIGGLLSWVAGAILYWGGFNFPDNDPYLWWAILVSNWAHFAASTVRLYTKPGAVKSWPFLTLAFPAIAVAVVTATLIVGEPFGRWLFAIYLVWSPYHYSRQAYGLSRDVRLPLGLRARGRGQAVDPLGLSRALLLDAHPP